jgi:hypothetical protein
MKMIIMLSLIAVLSLLIWIGCQRKHKDQRFGLHADQIEVVSTDFNLEADNVELSWCEKLGLFKGFRLDAEEIETAIHLLQPVWSIGSSEIEPVIDAVKKSDGCRMAMAALKLEKRRAKLATDPYQDHPVSRAVMAELQAKIVVLYALLTGDKDNWRAARAAYQNLGDAIIDIAEKDFRLIEHSDRRYVVALEKIRENVIMCDKIAKSN